MFLTYAFGILAFVLACMNYGAYLVWKQERFARIELFKEATKAEKEYEKHTKDLETRFQELKNVPVIAAMTDNQVSVLGEMLAIELKKIMEYKRDYVN